MTEPNFEAWKNREPESQNLQELWVYIQQLQAYIQKLDARITALGG